MGVSVEKRSLVGVVASYMGAAADVAVEKAARDVAEDAKRRIKEPPKTGRIYEHGPQPLPHQASAPDESPADWTGALAETVQYEIVAPGEAEVRVTSDHGPALEYGTADGRILPRPFLGPSMDAAPEHFVATLEEEFAAVVAGLGGIR